MKGPAQVAIGYSFAFHSQCTFLKAPPPTPQSKIVVAGIPWDGSTTNRPGARHGPSAIRLASHMLCDGTHDLFEVSPLDDGFSLGDVGDLNLPNTSLEGMRGKLEQEASSLFQNYPHVVWLGGDHSVTLSILRSLRRHLQRPVSVVHFDAHCDTWTDHFGEPSGHGTWVWEAFQEGLVVPQCFTQLGIRSSGDREARKYVSDNGGRIYTARDLRGLENKDQLKHVFEDIRKRNADNGNPPVYLTLDIDCLDPAYAPGTGTPEPGGFTTAQVLTLLEELVPSLPFCGMDCVEVSPPFDHAEITSQAAANFVHTYMCAHLSKK